MPRTNTPIITVEEAKRRFEEWRQSRKGKAPIPDEFWVAAVEVARKGGVNRTSTALRVEWNELKRRMAGAKKTRQITSAAFVEPFTPPEASLPECTIELEGRGGLHLLFIRWFGCMAGRDRWRAGTRAFQNVCKTGLTKTQKRETFSASNEGPQKLSG